MLETEVIHAKPGLHYQSLATLGIGRLRSGVGWFSRTAGCFTLLAVLVWIRTDSPTNVSLLMRNEGQTIMERTATAQNRWQRYAVAGKLVATNAPVSPADIRTLTGEDYNTYGASLSRTTAPIAGTFTRDVAPHSAEMISFKVSSK